MSPRSFALLLLVGGCGSNAIGVGNGADAALPPIATMDLSAVDFGTECKPLTASLVGDPGVQVKATIDAISASATPQDFCVRLDSTKLSHPAFQGATPMLEGASSKLDVSLRALDGSLLAQGGDVSIGSTNPTTFDSVSWSPGVDRRDVLIRIATTDQGTHTTSLTLDLFEPLD